MFTENEFRHIKKEFDLKQKQRKQKLMVIWGVLFLVSVVAIVSILLFVPIDFDNDDVVWILPVYGGLAIVGTLVGFIISMLFQSEKPFYTYLYDEVIQKINLSEGLFLKYSSYVKDTDKFNHRGGLFTRGAAVSINRHINGMSHDNHAFDIYDCRMVTSSGKSSHTHFDGVYLVIDKHIDTDIQVRSNGSPRLKGVKYQKQEGFTSFKVYKPEGQTLNDLDQKMIALFKSFYEDMNYKYVYISVVDDEIHVGIWYRKHPARKLKPVTFESLNKVAHYFLKEYALINKTSDINTY